MTLLQLVKKMNCHAIYDGYKETPFGYYLLKHDRGLLLEIAELEQVTFKVNAVRRLALGL